MEGAKETIKDAEGATVVLVDAVRVAAVVDAVLGGRVEDVLEGAEFADDLGVDPVLEEGVDLVVDGKEVVREEEGEGKVVDRREESVDRALSQSRRQVVLFTAVVHAVHGPESVDGVASSVDPVVEELYAHKHRPPLKC